MTQDRPSPTKHTFEKIGRPLDKFFKVDEYKGSFERFDNTMSPEQNLLVFERGDSVAALLFDPTHQEVILVEQFRLPTALNKGQNGGWILELAAGILQPGETVQASMMRELLEETGYQVSQLVPISTFFPSPGGTTERIHLFYAEIRRTQQTEKGGGVERDNEDIRIVHIPVAEFFAKLRAREFEDAKLIIAGYWLKDRLSTMPADHAVSAPPVEWALRQSKASPGWTGKPRPPKVIGYMRGDIGSVIGVDAWVNPLTSDMLLDRFTDRTISAVIRKRGAEKYPDGRRIKWDTIGEALRRSMNGRSFVAPATVIETKAGALERDNGVKGIFHVATTRVEFGELPHVDLQTLDDCAKNVLDAIERRGKYRSVLFPMIGTGEGALRVNLVAPRLLERAVKFFQENPRSKLRRIYFLAYSSLDAEAVAEAFERHKEELEPL